MMCRRLVQKTKGRLTNKRESGITESGAKEGTYGREDSLRMVVNGAISWPVCNKLYRAELWETIRFPDGHLFEDVETMCRVLDHCTSVTVIDSVLYYVRVRPGSITQTVSWKTIDEHRRAFSQLEEFVYAHMPEVYSEEHVQEVRGKRLYFMIVYYIRISYDDEVRKKALRKEIISTGWQVGFKKCTVRAKVAFFMIKYCPWLLKKACSVLKFAGVLAI